MASPEIVVLAEAPCKKARKQNFSRTEIATLTEKVEENLAILQSKHTNSITNQKKNELWSKIAAAVNAVGTEKRTLNKVKEKWKNLHSSAKKEKSQCDKYLVKWCESVVSCCASMKISS